MPIIPNIERQIKHGTIKPFRIFISPFSSPVTASAVSISASAIMLPIPAPTTPRERIRPEFIERCVEAILNKLPNIILETVTLPVMKAPNAPINGAKSGSNDVSKPFVIRLIAERICELLSPELIII